MSDTTVLFGNTAWPSGSSLGAFARDVIRIEKCGDDRQRVMAINKWLIRCFQHGPVLQLPRSGGWAISSEPGLVFNSWGHGHCTMWSWIAVDALTAAGIKARRVVNHNSQHTIFEAWYAGSDGKAGWHAFDLEHDWAFANESGDIASVEELAANPDLVIHPRPGRDVRGGNHADRRNLENYAARKDALDVIQHPLEEEFVFRPQLGQRYSSLWRPELPQSAWRTNKFPAGAHCDVSLFDEEGAPRYPEHLPYWQNYVWPCEDTGGISGNLPVRWHGCGALRWEPLRHGEQTAWRADNAHFENGTLRPTGGKKHCEVWWHFQLPYLVTYLRIKSGFDPGGQDKIGFSFSTDAGRTISPIRWGDGLPPEHINFGVAPDPERKDAAPEGPTIRGTREFWLRLDMSTQSANALPRVRHLQFTVGYQTNMHLLPRLLPGENPLYLRSTAAPAGKLTATWNYAVRGEEKSHALSLTKSGEATEPLMIAADKPQDVLMRGVTLRCE